MQSRDKHLPSWRRDGGKPDVGWPFSPAKQVFAAFAMQMTALLPVCVADHALADNGSASSAGASLLSAVASAAAENQPSTLKSLLALDEHQLETLDLARINLLCAEGLPGAANLDVNRCVATLNEWAEAGAA